MGNSLKCYEEAIKIGGNNSAVDKKIQKSKFELSIMLIKKGDIFYDKADYAEALKFYSKSLELYFENESIKKRIVECKKVVEAQQEIKEFENEQKEKGLVKYDDKWVTIKEAEEFELKRIESLSYIYTREFKTKIKTSKEYIPPKVNNPNTERVISGNYDEIWGKIVEQFASKQLPIKIIDKNSGIIIAEKSFGKSHDILNYINIGFSKITESQDIETFSCSNYSVQESDYYSYQTISEKCRLINRSIKIIKEYNDIPNIDIVLKYNVFVKKIFGGVKVSVNLSFISNEDVEFSTTGIFEQTFLDNIK